MEQELSVLENKTIGGNLYKFRKIREKKAADVAEHVGISESAYTKYDRGESQITIDFIQKVAKYLKGDPISIIEARLEIFSQTRLIIILSESRHRRNSVHNYLSLWF